MASRIASRRFWFRQRAKLGPLPPESGLREVVKEQRASGRGGDSAQLVRDASEEVFHRRSGTEGEDDAADADAHEGGHLQQLEPKGARLRTLKLGALQAKVPQQVEQHVGHGGEPQAQLVGPHRVGAGPVREDSQYGGCQRWQAMKTQELFMTRVAPKLRAASEKMVKKTR